MKTKLNLIIALTAAILLASCKENETRVDCDIVCSSTLLDFVEVTATIESGAEIYSVTLNKENMELFYVMSEQYFSDNGAPCINLYYLYKSRISKTYDYDSDPQLVVSFKKRDDVDYTTLGNRPYSFVTYANKNILKTEKGLFSASASVSESSNLGKDVLDNIYGPNVEDYIDNLITTEIVI